MKKILTSLAIVSILLVVFFGFALNLTNETITIENNTFAFFLLSIGPRVSVRLLGVLGLMAVLAVVFLYDSVRAFIGRWGI